MTSKGVTIQTNKCSPPAAQVERSEDSCFLTDFDSLYAPEIAGWVQSDQEQTWLAPSTTAPLTAHKVLGWAKNRRHAFLFWNTTQPTPIAYAELNNMPDRPYQMWIGHFIVDPTQRGRSYGARFARALLASAFVEYSASEVLLVVFPENVAAVRCYQRAGMITVGHEHKYFEETHRQHHFLRMSIDRARFQRLAATGRLSDKPLPFHQAANRTETGPPDQSSEQ